MKRSLRRVSTRRRLPLLTALLALALLLAGCAPATRAPTAQPDATPALALPTTAAGLVRVPVAIGAGSPFLYLAFQAARSLKYFEAEGLDVNLKYAPGEAPAEDALSAGGVLFAAQSLQQAIRAQAQGKTVKMIVVLARSPDVVALVRSDLSDGVRSPADFKGRHIGVGALGDNTHLLAALLAAGGGLKPDDYTPVAVGTGTMAAAFARRAIDVGFIAGPAAPAVLKTGSAVLLADLRTPAAADQYLGGEFPSAGLFASAATLQSRPELAQKMAAALLKAQGYLRAHTAQQIADALPDDLIGSDKQAWIDAYRASTTMYSPDGKSTEPGVANVIAAYRLFGAIPPNAALDPSALFDNTWVDR